MDDEIVSAVHSAGRLCESLGHIVEDVTPPWDLQALTPAMVTIIGSAVVNTIDGECERRGRDLEKDEVGFVARTFYDQSKSLTSRNYVQAAQTLHSICRSTAPFFEKYDVLLLSTLGRLPLPVGLLKTHNGDLPALMAKLQDSAPNTPLFNATGQPSMSVPLAWSASGLPIGIQFVGRAASESMLFRLAAQLEAARPWFALVPPAFKTH